MKILISCLMYNKMTGSELYVFDVAHDLLRRGHEVRIHSASIGDLFNNTDPNIIVSPRETTAFNPDVILAQHKDFSGRLINNTSCPVVYICHSRLYTAEEPYISSKIKKYISISDDIHEWLKSTYNIDSVVIPNGVNTDRFKPSDLPKEYGLIPGTADAMRLPFMKRLLKEKQEPMVFIGYGTNLLPRSAKATFLPATWNVEDYFAKAKWVAGLFNGRVQYEAWACGLDFYAYDEHGDDVQVTKPDKVFSTQDMVSEIEKYLIEAAS